ncbi:hypothetical protein ABW20_dc0106653 [Dactylellina cionopaga]|nr:hypothetical protein ABW20_dc0106653 [Dactylellina cionopaga]
MYSKRTTLSSRVAPQPTSLNKPFKSPLIDKPTTDDPSNSKKPAEKHIPLLLDDDIEDSDLEDDKEPEAPVDLSKRARTSASPAAGSLIGSAPSPGGGKDKIEDEIEESQTTPFKTVSRQNTVGKKGKFKTRADREKVQYQERKDSEKQADTENKDANEGAGRFKFKTFAAQKSLMQKVDKYDPIKLAKESPRKKEKKDFLGLARYDHVLKKNNIDPKILSLLNNTLESGEGSDSDDSTSSKKRKRASSGSPDDLIAIDDTESKAVKTKRTRATKEKYTCPMCDEEVSKELYESYLPDLPSKPALKRKFHKSHKVEKAHAKIKKLEIPDIDWENLGPRCTKYMPYLEAIMAKKTTSHYREISEEFFKSKPRNGKSRTEAMFEKGNWEKEYPGYYGPRGRDIIADMISSSKVIRAALKRLKQSKDTTTTKAGEGVYIQSILVPELATRLIMEDFEMEDDEVEKGRKLMLDTIDIGLALNDDNEDDSELNDGMDWWWKEQEEKRQQDEETEPSLSQASIYIEADD